MFAHNMLPAQGGGSFRRPILASPLGSTDNYRRSKCRISSGQFLKICRRRAVVAGAIVIPDHYCWRSNFRRSNIVGGAIVAEQISAEQLSYLRSICRRSNCRRSNCRRSNYRRSNCRRSKCRRSKCRRSNCRRSKCLGAFVAEHLSHFSEQLSAEHMSPEAYVMEPQ